MRRGIAALALVAAACGSGTTDSSGPVEFISAPAVDYCLVDVGWGEVAHVRFGPGDTYQSLGTLPFATDGIRGTGRDSIVDGVRWHEIEFRSASGTAWVRADAVGPGACGPVAAFDLHWDSGRLTFDPGELLPSEACGEWPGATARVDPPCAGNAVEDEASLPLAEDVAVFLLAPGLRHPTRLAGLDQFADYLAGTYSNDTLYAAPKYGCPECPGGVTGFPYLLTVSDGRVRRIDQMFLPGVAPDV